ncbi:5-Enolpyruvylshikimate-3-phosphate synthase [Candidatus Liberibacter solanacearum]|uniref:5-Enolpyruvylshikimate-3-phosphate synthase n=1 Tax=Candidatus Liberibacter solanacearum TaxID=556287 RepID=A0A0F4VL79_9HYPH|nr:5-Enolpyruvylshikimate-3-phosphate synthase [Candidatus Liberibacter solanacearum]
MKSYANDCKKAREHVFKKIYFSLQCCNLQYDLYSYRYIIVPLYYVEWKFFAIFI